MAIENLKQNIETEKEIIKEIAVTASQIQNLYNIYPYEKRETERKMLNKVFNSLIEQITIINNSVPELLNSISQFKSLDESHEKSENLVKINYEKTPTSHQSDIRRISNAVSLTKQKSVTINKYDKNSFLKELSISNDALKRIKKVKKELPKEEFMEFKEAGSYAKLSNKIFQNFSDSLINKGYFAKLNTNLRKANMPFLLVTYLSMMFFSTLLGILAGVIGFVAVFLLYPGSAALGTLLIPGLPGLVFASFYFFPAAEKKSVSSRINLEIPFVTIHMSAIAGSGIEPSQIFRILALGEEYKYTKTEIKKILNQVNIYGFDLVTALKNTARETSSKKLSELLNGMASAISGGSSLSNFLDKRSESLLFEYKLDKEKRTKSAETFMDIYISLMIAAPMIMTLLLVLIVVSSIDIGINIKTLTFAIVAIVAVINILFLVFLHLSGEEE